MKHSQPRLLVRVPVLIGLFAAYVLTARFGLSLASLNPSATPVWPPTGIAVGMMLVVGAWIWPAIFVGAFVVNILTAGSILTSLGIAVGNTLEAVIAARLVKRWAAGRHALGRASNIFRFIAFMLPSAAVSASIGVTTLSIGGYAQWPDYGSIWLTWWLGDLSGALIVAPLILAWNEPGPPSSERDRSVEAALLILVVAASATAVFAGIGTSPSRAPIAFLTIPPLVWAAFRFGQRETVVSIAVLSTIATWNTARGVGPFAIVPDNTSLLLLQMFMVTISAMALPMAALVSEQKRVESERGRLLKAEQLARADAEAANVAKDEFLAMLGHELRNPLAAIATAGHVLDLAAPRQGVAGQAQAVIARQSRHLSHLVDDLLDVTRVKTGKITLDRSSVALAGLVSRTVDTLRLAGAKDQARIDVHIDESPIWVDGDPTRLEQVVTNLLTNAVKYTPAQGVVDISTTIEQDEAVLRVKDTGIGIAPELLPHVFDQFTQGDRGPERSRGGLGLGLTLVKRLVELHGGSVSAESDGPQHGSVFTVRLPLASPGPNVHASTFGPARARRRVLLIEDQADAREMMRSVLEMAGHEVLEAADGPSGVQAACELVPDIAFVDIGLPVFDGYEVARQVRRRHADLFLIALTGYGQPQDRERAEAAGFDLHLVKPVEPERICELVAALPRFATFDQT